MRLKLASFSIVSLILFSCNPKLSSGLRKNDLHKDVEMTTTKGVMVIRLSDETTLHRDNFLRLVKSHYYDSVLFHRVIRNFMIQAGDPDSKSAAANEELGNGGPSYTVPAEFRPDLFHRKGAIAAARTGDDINPQKASSGSQFYIVQGKKFTDQELNAVEAQRLQGYKIPSPHREVYKTEGGTPHLDQQYTVFGEVIKGLAVIDSIASVRTSPYDRPVDDVRIIRVKLIKRK